METISTQIRDLFAEADSDGQKKLVLALKDLQGELETDMDVLLRLGSSVSCISLAKRSSTE
jgi:hypothetical protein